MPATPSAPRRWLSRLLLAAVVVVLSAGTVGCGSSGAGSGELRTVSQPAAGGDYRLVNTDGYPSDSTAVFNVEGRDNRADIVTHTRVTFRLVPTGSAPVQVQRVDVPAGWVLAAPVVLPATATAAAPLAVTLQMVPLTHMGLRTGTATVITDSTVRPTTVLHLTGFAQPAVGGPNEPTLQQLVELFGWTTTTLRPGQRMATRGAAGRLVGAEVHAPAFTAKVHGRPVTVRELAAFHRLDAGGPLGWRPAAAPEGDVRPLLSQAPLQAQTVLPTTDSGIPAVATFSPAGPFALVANGQDTDDRRNSPTADRSRWNCAGRCGHHIRTYPVLDRAAHPIPGSWLVCVDYNTPAPGATAVGHEHVNYDYQDAVYLLTNAQPAG